MIEQDSIYLDYAGSPPVPKRLIDAFAKDLTMNLYGNPHSASISSQLSTSRIEDIRVAALNFFNADPTHFDLIFVQNATAAIKLVQTAFCARPGGYWYGYHVDSHTSLVGVREGATRGRHCFQSDAEVESWLTENSHMRNPSWESACPGGHSHSHAGSFLTEDDSFSSTSNETRSLHSETSTEWSEYSNRLEIAVPDNIVELLAFPAQSNMNGRRLPLDWCRKARLGRRKRYVLLDAASMASTAKLDLSDLSAAPDFVALSFYKIFGFPDLGALIVRKDSAGALLNRTYFGGGTVDMASVVDEQWHIPRTSSLHAAVEDGTLPFHSIIALGHAMDSFAAMFGQIQTVSAYCAHISGLLYAEMRQLEHYNGNPLCEFYNSSSPENQTCQGPIIAFNLRQSSGAYYSTSEVEKTASVRGIHIRSGGLCNPGGLAHSLHLTPWEMRENLSSGLKCGTEHDLFANGRPTGMLRISLGPVNTSEDIAGFKQFLKDFYVELKPAPRQTIKQSHVQERLRVSQLLVYPIKSCGGWQVPSDHSWEIRQEGLAWDREWCIVHRGTREVLNQKRCPRMACIRPQLDFAHGLLRIRHCAPGKDPKEIAVPLSANPSVFEGTASDNGFDMQEMTVCGDTINAKLYSSKLLAVWLSGVLNVPCQLARFPPADTRVSARHIKRDLVGASHESQPGSYSTSPLLLSNESPILTITEASLARLNFEISARGSEHANMWISAAAFRPNIVLASADGKDSSMPYSEDFWERLALRDQSGEALDVIGPCRRCQMVCIDQKTARRHEEPYVTLARTRKRDGKVWFGMHARLSAGEGSNRTKQATIQVGDAVQAFGRT